MELEALSLPPSSKQNYTSKVADYKRRYFSAFRELSSLKLGLNRSSNDLEGGSDPVDKYLSSLSKNNNKLRNAIIVGNETEIVARDTKINLHSNTDKLQGIQSNMGRVKRELTISDKLINIIKRNEQRNKIIIYCVILFLIIAVGIIVYFGIFRK